MEVICIDGKFPPDAVDFYTKWKVSTPVEDSIYSIRSVIRHASKVGDEGAIGFWLEEIRNPKVPVGHPVLGLQMVEPSWNHNRFRALTGEMITEDALREMMKSPSRTQTVVPPDQTPN
jgi:hypothetical protein